MARRRPDSKFHKQLKPWRIEPAPRPGWIKITCGNCGNSAFVKRGAWLHGATKRYIGRSCTFCFKTGRVTVYEDQSGHEGSGNREGRPR